MAVAVTIGTPLPLFPINDYSLSDITITSSDVSVVSVSGENLIGHVKGFAAISIKLIETGQEIDRFSVHVVADENERGEIFGEGPQGNRKIRNKKIQIN